VILSDVAVQPNVSGCISLVEADSVGGGCGARLQAVDECEAAACAHCSTLDSFVKCTAGAAMNLCANYSRVASSCWTRIDFGICRSGTTFEQRVIALAKIFCISGLDGGTTFDAGAPPEAGLVDSQGL
jgi:hypothetical protein